jgi:cysteinyl-tRNA synthetase
VLTIVKNAQTNLQKLELKLLKEQQKLDQQRKILEKEEKAKIAPNTMFLAQKGELYSVFDENGIPTHDKDNIPLAKNVIKKLQKEYNKQKELHEAYLSKLNSNSTMTSSLG